MLSLLRCRGRPRTGQARRDKDGARGSRLGFAGHTGHNRHYRQWWAEAARRFAIARILCCIYEGYLGYFPYICRYNPNIFQRMSNNKFFSSGVVLGLLVVAIILLLLALSVFIVWGCAYVHWLLASGVGCTLGIVWLLGITGVMGMVCRASRRPA